MDGGAEHSNSFLQSNIPGFVEKVSFPQKFLFGTRDEDGIFYGGEFGIRLLGSRIAIWEHHVVFVFCIICAYQESRFSTGGWSDEAYPEYRRQQRLKARIYLISEYCK